MGYKIGSARIDERGHASGGVAGDQKQKTTPDYKGEVSIQDFYIHSKGWYILRPKDPAIGHSMAQAMVRACNNPNIGYDQGQRLGIIKYGTLSKVKTECDCSSLVRQCVIEASGKDPGNFTTMNEAQALIGTRMFDRLSYDTSTVLKLGDVLVTKSKGHTAIVVEVEKAYPTLRKGSTGPWVHEAQTLLNYSCCLKVDIDMDGDFGTETEAAVKTFQEKRCLKVDGIIGPKTWEALKK